MADGTGSQGCQQAEAMVRSGSGEVHMMERECESRFVVRPNGPQTEREAGTATLVARVASRWPLVQRVADR